MNCESGVVWFTETLGEGLENDHIPTNPVLAHARQTCSNCRLDLAKCESGKTGRLVCVLDYTITVELHKLERGAQWERFKGADPSITEGQHFIFKYPHFAYFFRNGSQSPSVLPGSTD